MGEDARDRTVRSAGRWHGREPLYAAVVRLLDLVVRALFRLRVVHPERLPATGPALIAANHVSFLDPVVLAVIVARRGGRARFFAHESLFRKPVLGWLLEHARQIPVYRGLGTARATAYVREALDAGQLVVVYPEGTIPPPGDCPPARRGVGLVATHCDVPVIPVAMWGMQRGREGYRLRLRRPAAVVVGEPVDLREYRAEHTIGAEVQEDATYQAASDAILAVIREHLLPEAQRHARTAPRERAASSAR